MGGDSQECFLKEVAPLKSLLPLKIFKKFFRVGVWGGFEWVGGIGNSETTTTSTRWSWEGETRGGVEWGFMVGVVLGVI